MSPFGHRHFNSYKLKETKVMKTLKIISMTGVTLALVFSTPANATSCYNQTVAAMQAAWPKAAGPMTPALTKDAIQKAGVEELSKLLSSKVEESCRLLIADNARAYAGLNQPVEPKVEVAKPPVTEAAIAPAKTEAKPAEKTVVDTTAADAAVKRAEAAATAARRDRDAAATKLQQLINRPGVSADQINAATAKLREADQQFIAASTAAAEAKQSALDAKAAATRAAASAQGAATSEDAAEKAAATAAEAAEDASFAADEAREFGFPLLAKILLGLSILLALVAGGIAWFRKPKAADVQAAVKTALDTEALSHTSLKAEMTNLKGEVAELSADLGDSNKKRLRIEIPEALENTLQALPIGKSAEIVLTVEGKKGLISFTKVGDGQVETADIINQTQAMNIVGIITKLNRAIGAGRVSMRSIAQAVNE